MSERKMPPGTQLFFGVPAKPMPGIMVDAIGQVVAQVPGIREAYLPQCFIQGDTEARQVLVVGIDNDREIPKIMDELMSKMRLVLPKNQFLDILPFPVSKMPCAARVAECKIHESKPQPRWKVVW
jgi:SseB protein C-terminal domain